MTNPGSNTDRWAVEDRVKPNSYTKHNSTIWRDKNIESEPVKVEYRVETKEDNDLIYRVESEKNIFIISIDFVLYRFLENMSDYYEGNIVVNSEKERNLLL